MTVQMALRRIIINEAGDQHYIVLHELDGPRKFTIVIGISEATAIERRAKKIESPRPLTHDLVVNAVQELGGEVRDVVITDLREHTYYAKLRVARDGEIVEVDCRPSDAVAVAVAVDVPIYVDEEVLEAANEE